MPDFEKIQLGECVTLRKEITADLINSFADLSGDNNPLHMNKQFAQQAGFQRRVAHGMLVANYVSALIGTQLPGPGALWVKQTFCWHAPVFIGDTVDLSLTVIRKSPGTRTLTIQVNVVNQSKVLVMDGEGVVMALEQRESANKSALNEQVAIVTGASRGIGSATASVLASAGVKVIVNYLKSSTQADSLCREIIHRGGKAVAVQADITDADAVAKMIEQSTAVFGKPVDILINNASGPIAPMAFMDTQWIDVQAHIDVQVKGAFNLCKSVLPGMLEQKSGCIINIGSIAAWDIPPANWANYVIAKAALRELTRSLALEFGPFGVRVNMVSPGMTETDLIANIPERLRKVQAMQTPLRRLATPDDIAQTILFLCSEAGNYITGVDIPVAGGRAM